MTQAWRLTTERYAATAFDGEGAKRFGGRWNRQGVAAVYVAATISLAALEYLAGVDIDLVPPALVVIPVEWGPEVPVHRLEVGELARDWRAYPHAASTRDLGTRWIEGGATPILSVPSAIVPDERIFVLNPAHPRFGDLAIGTARPFAFDPRLW